MAKQYQWRATTDYRGDTTLSYGVIPNTSATWQNGDIGESGSGTWQYWYRDSNTPTSPGVWTDAISSRLVVTVTQSWTTSVDQRNYLTVTVDTSVDSVVRDDIRGVDTNTPGRLITFQEKEGSSAIFGFDDEFVATARTIMATPRSLPQNTFTIPPGQGTIIPTLFIDNHAYGTSSYDHIWAGVEFRNPLPADFRPGATLKGDNEYGPTTGVWVTHNDKNAGCHVLADVDNMTWKEMRTVGDGTLQTKAPSILTADDDPDSWYNQRELGKYLRT